MKKYYALLMVAVLLISLAAGAAYAKYVTQEKLEGTVTITANLGTITLQEHLAVRQTDGSYVLTNTLLPIADDPETDDDEAKLGNTYTLLPGLDVPKDPHIVITNKTPIACYVYVEVVSKLDGSALTYEVDVYNGDADDAEYNPGGKWIKLSGVIGKNGGTVYVYTGGTSEAKAVIDDLTVDILENNQVSVSQHLNNEGMKKTGLGLSFYASMYQTAAGKTAEEVYRHYNSKDDNTTTN